MIIHQALHGYRQGHNLLACSAPLSLKDDDRMKMLSDWSEYSGHNEDNSYITTYPLSDGKHYVVAKSWYADEMNRPGCVWTHSLIIDLTNLDENFDFRTLNILFKRPVEGGGYSYSEAIHYVPEEKCIDGFVFAEDVLIWLYVNLVNQDRRMLYRVEQNSSYYQSIILVMLQYLPLGILRSIAMCSGSAYGRKATAVTFNLQFVLSGGESLCGVVRDSKDAINGVCEGVKSICHSMVCKDSDTDEALRVFSKDIGDSPLRLCGVGLLLKYLDDVIDQLGNVPSFSQVLSLMTNTFPSIMDGEAVKVAFCKKEISNLFSAEYIVLVDLVTQVLDGWVDLELVSYSQRVAALKAEGAKDEFIKYLIGLVEADKLNTVGESVLKKSDKYLNINDYEYISQKYWPLYMSLVMANASVLKYSFWVDFQEDHFVAAYDVFREHCFDDFDAWDKLFLVVLYRNHTMDSHIMGYFTKYVSDMTFRIMEYLNKSIECKLSPLLHNYCTNHIDDILNWLKKQNELTPAAEAFLVNHVDPKAKMVKDAGSVVWNVLERSRGDKQCEYYIFFFLLGHIWSDINALQFIKRSFFPIHEALAKSMLPDNLWRKIEPYTAKLNFLKEWDKCQKLRLGTVAYLKSVDYPRTVLDDFTPDEELNNSLKAIWDKD